MTRPDTLRRTTTEIVAAYLRGRGWPHAQPTRTARSDLSGIPAMAVEVRTRRRFTPTKTLLRHRVRAGLGLLGWTVYRQPGHSPAAVDSWAVVLRLDDFTRLLADAGYGGGPDVGPDLNVSHRPQPRDEA